MAEHRGTEGNPFTQAELKDIERKRQEMKAYFDKQQGSFNEGMKEMNAAGIKPLYQSIPVSQAIAICRYMGYTVAKH